MPKNLILSGGIFHPFDESSQALTALLGELGIHSETVTDVDEAANRLHSGDFQMFTVNALRWGMMTADKYEPFRKQWAYQTPQSTRDAFTRFVQEGGALLGMHTASICFDDWPGWRDLLGGQWQWGTSHHPELGRVEATIVQHQHPVVHDASDFTLTDEVYHDLSPLSAVNILVHGLSANGGTTQPVLWTHNVGLGRVVYDALGHSAESIEHPQHKRILSNAARWLLSA